MILSKGNAPDLMALMPFMANAHQSWLTFSSPESICEHVKDIPKSQYWDKECFGTDPYFYGTESLQEAIGLCRDGWQEGATRAAALRDRINVNNPTQRRYVRYGVAGAIPDVPRYLAGNPMHMKRLDSVNARQRPIITLINHVGGLGGVDSACFINKAATVCAIVDAIEGNGFSCHVIGMAMSRAPNGGLVGVAFTVKEPGDHMDIGRAAFALGHTAMFRRLVFAARYSDDDSGNVAGFGTLSTVDTAKPRDGTYILPSMNINEKFFGDESTAESRGLNHLIQSLRDHGCPAFRDDAMAA